MHLTNHDLGVESGLRDRPEIEGTEDKAAEITLTSEMVSAGARCAWRHPLFEEPSDEDGEMEALISDIFRAMMNARR
jgi:hypothetical protein